MRDGLPMDADHAGLNRAFAAAAKPGLPVNLLCRGILDKGLPHIQRHPDTVVVIDHLGRCSVAARRSLPTFGPVYPSCSAWLNPTASSLAAASAARAAAISPSRASICALPRMSHGKTGVGGN